MNHTKTVILKLLPLYDVIDLLVNNLHSHVKMCYRKFIMYKTCFNVSHMKKTCNLIKIEIPWLYKS